MSISEKFKRAAEANLTKSAIFFRGQALTYRELLGNVRRLSSSLSKEGVRKGERVAILLPNSPEFITAYLAVLQCGATVVPINFLLKPEEIEYILSHSEASFLISLSRLLEPVAPALNSNPAVRVISVDVCAGLQSLLWSELLASGSDRIIEPSIDDKEDVASILYTSGTTGHPKGVMLTHYNLLSNTSSVFRALRCTSDDRFLCVLPLFYTFATTVCFLTPLLHGLSVVVVERFMPAETLMLIAEKRVSIFAGVPSMYAVWANMDPPKVDFSAWRVALSGGAALPEEVQRGFEAEYPVPIYEGDGPTECSPVTSVNPIGGKRKPRTIGLPIPDVEMKIFDENDYECGPNEIGEIVVRGPNVMKGYWKDPEATREALRSGWLHTGDIGKRDLDGYFYILDRKKDMVIVGGMNVYSREVEEVLYRHPAVKEAAVIALPDPIRGEIPKAFVVLKEAVQLSERELIRFLRPHLADYKIPRAVEFREDLPKSAQGKILKKVLRETEQIKDARV
ncbi:MAG: long-chain fatty acid--CoA ligase [Candidatus Omnitrophica bacterium]|nr:long-chain fatty acid--CoA ligase [Candidatus Omnitrophota bacterium]